MRPIHFLATRPFLASLVVLLIVIVPGYWRLDVLTTENHETANDVKRLVRRIEAQAVIDERKQCQLRNSGQRSTRQTFTTLFDRIVEMGSDPKAVDELREALPKPAKIDVDCDEDGQIDNEDYERR